MQAVYPLAKTAQARIKERKRKLPEELEELRDLIRSGGPTVNWRERASSLLIAQGIPGAVVTSNVNRSVANNRQSYIREYQHKSKRGSDGIVNEEIESVVNAYNAKIAHFDTLFSRLIDRSIMHPYDRTDLKQAREVLDEIMNDQGTYHRSDPYERKKLFIERPNLDQERTPLGMPRLGESVSPTRAVITDALVASTVNPMAAAVAVGVSSALNPRPASSYYDAKTIADTRPGGARYSEMAAFAMTANAVLSPNAPTVKEVADTTMAYGRALTHAGSEVGKAMINQVGLPSASTWNGEPEWTGGKEMVPWNGEMFDQNFPLRHDPYDYTNHYSDYGI